MTTIDTATGAAAPAEISSERVKGIFAHIAPRYERFNAISSFGAYKLWLRTMAKMAPISSESHVLDVAGGTGEVSFTMAQRKRPASIVCTDLVPEMLEVARAHHAEGRSGDVSMSFQVADAHELPFEDARFDVVTVAYGIRNMPNRPRALAEMLRVLKPEGHLVCLDFSTPPNPAWRGLYGFYLKHMIPLWGGLITGDRAGFVYLADSIRAFPDQAGLARLMREAGFVDVEWRNCTGGVAAVHVARRPGTSHR
ncbi:class I SAM-dependent methyltransferase [Adlercreutzia murintestinalis]|uniref:class I SAM-dependent methyltransferase n=1 Tax=Adlercreutzia murintestinalis TaxID=2941325 RepID=UPI00203E5B37|nr:class I SAM-dependent methyltransferase [Adlercreutzia murintestinalis]